MEHIKPSTVSNFCALLYLPPHLLMSFIDRHILMLTIATYIPPQQAKYQRNRRILQEWNTVTEITQQYMVGHVSATTRKAKKENNTTHDSDDAAIFSMEIHAFMNRDISKCSLLINTL